jgi:CRISPR-associated protein Csx3
VIRAGATLGNPSGLVIELLDNGSIAAIRHGEVLINQVVGGPLEGGLGSIHLRRRTRTGPASVPLLGPGSASRFRVSADGAAWDGSVDGLEYSCLLRLAAAAPTWFWTIRLRNGSSRRLTADVVHAQDLGLAHEAAVLASELYTSQYIDHTILEDADLGFLICSRQNLPQGDTHPWVVHGCLAGASGYLTDGFQLYGLGYRASNNPAALGRSRLPGERYQYEVALPTLQSRPLGLAPGLAGEITFFGAFEPDHPAASGAADVDRARAAAAAFEVVRNGAIDGPERPRAAGLFDAPALFQSEDLGPADLDGFFGPDRRHVERRAGTLLSFFHGADRHVVLRAKELVQERPTGHIMRSGQALLPSDDTLSVTAWMSGVFGSQLTIGNTSFNAVLGVCRSPLNVLKSSGVRIALRTDRGDELLGLPSAFEMGPNDARWIYQDSERSLSIRLATSDREPVCRLAIEIVRGGPLELVISHQVILGADEGGPPGRVVVDAEHGRIELRPASGTPMATHYPDAAFFIVTPDADRIAAIGGDGLLQADGADRGTSHVVIRTKPVTRFSLAFTGSVVDATRADARATAELGGVMGAGQPAETPRESWSGLGRRPSLVGALAGEAGGATTDAIARLNDLLPWFAHDAMIHFTAPHGLEQHSGAAWGLRDVCQGPTELLVASANLGPLRDVLRIVYEQQSRQTGDWPQWFMFDRYRTIRAPDSHADIIHWPIKALCDYVEASGDLSILDEPVAWTDDETAELTAGTATIFEHTERQVERIERDCIPGTALPIFGGGDWEDTLQPADPAMARRLVSAWTVELAYQTLERYREVCARAGRDAMAARLTHLCDRMRADFQEHLLPDGIVAGLAHFGDGEIDYFLHPRDRKTGVSYRLLPMTRGMLSGLFSVDQMERHAALIERHLRFPDGVRLMDRPMDYTGGTSRYFRRAESAANFGREVGLQYVHAHIRYIEAMARIGRPEEAFWGLMAVCPIGLETDVPAALPRQANAYFSSSDAAFRDRDQASREFGRLRAGTVGVKGGWRVYSSGPGIYVNQLISNVLGVRTHYDDVVLDPVLPRGADGLTFDSTHEGRSVRYTYHVAGRGFGPSRVQVNGRPLAADGETANPYRRGGFVVARSAFGDALDREDNVVEIVV